MTFLFYKTNGTFGITNTNINDILKDIQLEDIIDGLDEIGIQLNRHFKNMDATTKYVLWINQRTGNADLDLYKDGESEDAEEFKISDHEIQTLLDYFGQQQEQKFCTLKGGVTAALFLININNVAYPTNKCYNISVKKEILI